MINSEKILGWIYKFNKSLFDIPVYIQKEYLEHFPEPRNDFERSYFQYKCQMLFNGKITIWGQNMVAILMFPFVALILLMRSKPAKNVTTGGVIVQMNGINMTQVPEDVIGEGFMMGQGKYLKFGDVLFAIKILLMYPFSPFFAFKILLNISQYRYIISKYLPNEIVVHWEYSFCSSVLTYFCNKQGVKHINMMHGEKLFYVRDSFFRFDKCYVWDEHYVELFSKMRAGKQHFVISCPESIKINTCEYLDDTLYADYKYYLADQTEDELRKIVEAMTIIESKGFSVKFRPHLRATNMICLMKLVDIGKIESPTDVSIQQSLANTSAAVSCFSTVLFQAYNAKRKIIIDDVVFKERYDKLKILNYIITQKKHQLLSNEIHCI